MHDTPGHKVHCTHSRKPPVALIRPAFCSAGTYIIQHAKLPARMLKQTRIPMIAPDAMKIGSQLNITVRPTHVGPKKNSLNLVQSVSLENAASLGMTAKPSWMKLSMAAISPAIPSAFAARIPFCPCECKARNVSAAATPLGKRSCSMLIICFFIGMAIVTPRMARKKTHAKVSGNGSAIMAVEQR
jgi:hypothetical protein